MDKHRTPLFYRAHAYMFLFALRFTEVYWVVYLREKGLSFAAVPGSAGWLPRTVLMALCLCLPVVSETLYPLFSDAVNCRTGSLNRAAVLSAGGMMFSVSMMVTFPLIGFLGDRLGLRWGIVAGACLTALCIAPVALALLGRRGAHPDLPSCA